MTPEQMDAVETYLDTFQSSAAPEGLTSDAINLWDIQQVWAEVRPVVEAIHNFFLTPKKWKTALQKWIDKLDAIFPNP